LAPQPPRGCPFAAGREVPRRGVSRGCGETFEQPAALLEEPSHCRGSITWRCRSGCRRTFPSCRQDEVCPAVDTSEVAYKVEHRPAGAGRYLPVQRALRQSGELFSCSDESRQATRTDVPGAQPFRDCGGAGRRLRSGSSRLRACHHWPVMPAGLTAARSGRALEIAAATPGPSRPNRARICSCEP